MLNNVDNPYKLSSASGNHNSQKIIFAGHSNVVDGANQVMVKLHKVKQSKIKVKKACDS